jgi:hypothetical protein
MRRWLRHHGLPLPASLEGEAFETYKQARARLHPGQLSGLRVPCTPGLVSVILPVYNGQRYLGDALDSILVQTRTDLELIAVDDGSTDATPRILDGYARRDSRIRIITQRNEKLPAALSRGFRAARGEFLTWISADNRVYPEFLRKMANCLEQHAGWDAIYANEDLIGDDGRLLRDHPAYAVHQKPYGSGHVYFPEETSELNAGGDNFVGAAFLYRACVPFLVGEYSDWWFGLEDYDYWMRVNDFLTLRHADFREPVYAYRHHGESLTSRHKEMGVPRMLQDLLATDARRRQSAMRPLTWSLEGDEARPQVVAILDQLRASVVFADARHSGSAPLLKEPPDPSLPRVHISVRSAACGVECPRAPGRKQICRVLVWSDAADLPPEVPAEWDVCVVWSSVGIPPGLPRARQGWLATADPAVLIHALDIRARCDAFAAAEQRGEWPRGSDA